MSRSDENSFSLDYILTQPSSRHRKDANQSNSRIETNGDGIHGNDSDEMNDEGEEEEWIGLSDGDI
jgi:hypothetical protein